ncbi:uncharacterized protein LOC143888448 [Tasmannia lanceolata]|uniref:uncharacterized protein LOC143888448 n=1 Tax=Tasmannia lanceolata TaxID=3420 RepID=UPI004062F09C
MIISVDNLMRVSLEDISGTVNALADFLGFLSSREGRAKSVRVCDQEGRLSRPLNLVSRVSKRCGRELWKEEGSKPPSLWGLDESVNHTYGVFSSLGVVASRGEENLKAQIRAAEVKDLEVVEAARRAAESAKKKERELRRLESSRMRMGIVVRWEEGSLGVIRRGVRLSLPSNEDKNELIDLPMSGRAFTWARGESRSRIDRFFISSEWMEMVSDVFQKALLHSVSDHCPILLDPSWESWGPSPFRFDIAWLEIPKMEETLGEWWGLRSFEGPTDVVIGKKLRFVKNKVREWAKVQKEQVLAKKKGLESRLSELVALEDCGLGGIEEHEELGKIKQEYQTILLHEEISWKQKSRVRWLAEGDKNTAYFHAIASARRRRNKIVVINKGGQMVSSKEGISSAIIEFYSNLYSSEDPIPEDVAFSSLSLEDSSKLEVPFGEEEIEKALFSLPRDKAPGPDGFCLAFFQACWFAVKSDILKFFKEFHEGLHLDKGTGATFITLIPKKEGASKITDFRPISLIGCLYKVLAKVLADRIKLVLPLLISNSQNAFVDKRQILDCSLVANEVIDYYRRNGEKWVVCKLDMEKAFDRVEWNCLDYLLGRMGFGNVWRGWIRRCVSSARFSILINETLSKLVQKSCEKGLIEGFRIGRNKVEVSILQFADDTLIFCEPDFAQVKNLKATLRCYEMITSQRSNFSKSSLFALNMSSADAGECAVSLGCKVESLPSSYLVSVELRIEKIQRRFLWGGSSEKRGIPLTKWEKVCVPIRKGGLGIRRIKGFNAALLSKWLWRFGEERSALWARVIGSRYEVLSGTWESDDIYERKGLTIWRDILKLRFEFTKGCRFKVYSGNRIKFWRDVWCANEALEILFPKLMRVAADKDAMVGECFERVDNKVVWCPKFRRNFFDRELEALSALFEIIEKCYIKKSGEDKRIWMWNSSGFFSIKSAYSKLAPEGEDSWVTKSIPLQLESWDFVPWKKKGKTLWKICLLALWWSVWKERNGRVFEGKASSAFSIFQKIIALSIQWAKSTSLFRFVSAYDLWERWETICKEGVCRSKVVQKWAQPPEGFCKLNVDGASFGNPGASGFGGLLRDHDGAVKWAFSGPNGISDSSEAEVKAAYYGILHMERTLLDKVIMEGDSSNVVRWLAGLAPPPWRFLSFFDEIADWVANSSISFLHIRRTANEEADALAKSGVNRQYLEWFDDLPP